MQQRIVVSYVFHSGFTVNDGDILLIFDYWRGENAELPEEAQLTKEYLASFRKVYVFVSHTHPDHFDEVIYDWRDAADVTYIVSPDMPVGKRGRRMAPGDELTLQSNLKIKAFDSTDLGVSFLVHFNDFHLFHAGDLNFWHWRDESSVSEIEEAQRKFLEAMAPIEKETIDVCFFPLDPRQNELYDAGANYFIMSVKPRLMIPMHFWQRADIAKDYARRSRTPDTEILVMSRPGEQMLLELDENNVLNITSAMPDIVIGTKPLTAHPSQQEPDMMNGENPFLDSDMPVDLNKEG